MSDEYQQSSQQHFVEQDAEQFQPTKRRLTKNQQIYGDFVQAYEPQHAPSIFSKKSYTYGQFKAGASIQTYSSQVQVDLPKTKPKPKPKLIEQDEEDDKPMLGKFTLNSFLNQLGGGDDLNQIQQEDNEDSSEQIPIGLNDKIQQHLQLFKVGEEEETQEVLNLNEMSFEKYMQMGRPAAHRAEPKYKTEQEKELAKKFADGYGMGFKMMEKMGFKNINKGLGRNQTGTHKPVEAVHKTAFTMKDDNKPKQNKKQFQSDSQAQQQAQAKVVPIPEQLFQYRSKNRKINNFLLDLQKDFQRLNSQVYFLQNEIQSIKTKNEINLSTQFQQQRKADELKKQIQKLSVISENIDKCEEFPYLGQHYQVDVLFVKKTYDKLKESNIDVIHQNAQKQLSKLKSALTKFYLAKSKQNVKMFQQSTAIEKKIHMNFPKKHKKDSNVIDLDNLSEDQVQILTIGVDQQQKIKRFTDVIIAKTVIPIIEYSLKKVESLDRVKDQRVIDLIDVVIKFEQKPSFAKKIVKQRIYPLFQAYIRKINFNDFQGESNKVLPHLIILPWLHLLKLDPNFNLLLFYRKIATKLWNLETSLLLNVVSPFLKFSSPKELSFFRNLCLAPRLLNQLQTFSINNPNTALLNGFVKYSELLDAEVRDEILENTLFLQVQQVYNKYIKQKEEKEISKWLKNWRKFSDKISQGKFDSYFQRNILNKQ